ncbi:MAG: indole-3-glycerol phosphate synthase TrpC, partial [Pseudomonadota bacterium]
MIDPLQVIEARAYGADAILIIMAAVSDALAEDLEATAQELSMDVLIEIHDALELDRALRLKSALIGINNRDLTRMSTDLSVTERLASRIPSDRQLVSESGVKTTDDILRLKAVGARRFLIGESLMKQTDRTHAVRELVHT